VQRVYWDTGYFLSFWTAKNIPAILLAVPTVVAVAHLSLHFFGALLSPSFAALMRGGPGSEVPFTQTWAALPHVLHLLATALPVLLFAHVNVVTRVVFAHCPVLLYWVAMRVDQGGWEKKWVVAWIVVGGVMHANYLPWT
jgi:hypothetical protein